MKNDDGCNGCAVIARRAIEQGAKADRDERIARNGYVHMLFIVLLIILGAILLHASLGHAQSADASEDIRVTVARTEGRLDSLEKQVDKTDLMVIATNAMLAQHDHELGRIEGVGVLAVIVIGLFQGAILTKVRRHP